MSDIHVHNGADMPFVDIRTVTGPTVIHADASTGVSALRVNQPLIIQRGFYSLVSNVTNLSASLFITFAQPYSETTTLGIYITPYTSAAQAFHVLNGIVTSGFTVSGTNVGQTGNWLSIGYK